MLKIRMQRTGRTNMPSYRIVVVEHTASPKAGSFVDKVGTYNPKTKERLLDEAKIKHWLSVGAQASATVHNMLVSAGIISGKKINVLPSYKPAPTEASGAPAPTDSTSSPQAEAPAAETPAAEAAAPADAPADSTSSPQAEEVKGEGKTEAPAETPAQ